MYEILIEKPGRYVVSSDGVYETSEGDNAPIIAHINNDGHVTEITCQTVETVSADVDLSVLDARYAPLSHTHVQTALLSGDSSLISQVVTYNFPLVLSPFSTFQIDRVGSGGYLVAFGVGGVVYGRRFMSPDFASYVGTYLYDQGALSVTMANIFVNYQNGQYFWRFFS